MIPIPLLDPHTLTVHTQLGLLFCYYHFNAKIEIKLGFLALAIFEVQFLGLEMGCEVKTHIYDKPKYGL